jgi:enediyne biosynthesis protein E4
MRIVRPAAAMLLLFSAGAVQADAPAPPAPPATAAAPRLPVFTDVTERAGLRFSHSYGDVDLDNIVEGTGSGACVFDYDGDGRLDLYFPNGRWLKAVSTNRSRALQGQLANSLYRNNGDGTFTDVTAKAGVEGTGFGFGCAAADYDGDGDLDLHVLNYGPDDLYRNNGDGTFTNVAVAAGLADPRWGLNAVWFDYDRDGRLDVYVCNYLLYDDGKFRAYYPAAGYPGPLSYNGQPSVLYHNDGDGTFSDASAKAGVGNPGGRCMSAVAADLNNDGWPDLYQANDAMENYYYENTGRGSFVDKGLRLGLAMGQHGQGVSSMGPVAGDVDDDGFLDLFIPDMDYGSLLVREGPGYVDRIEDSGLAVMLGQYTGWGGILFDYDDDGRLDLFVSNGNAHHEYAEDPVLARGDGAGKFADVARGAGDFFQHKWVARGSTWLDYDDDGDLDLLVVDLNGPPHLLRNEGGTGHHWIAIDARLPGGRRQAIGARITVTAGGRRQVRDALPVNGYLSQGDPRVHFGLGAAGRVDAVEIRWPDGTTGTLTGLAIDRVNLVVQGGR